MSNAAIVTVLAFFIDYRYPKESEAKRRGPSLSRVSPISLGLDLALIPDDKGFRRVIESRHAGTPRLKTKSVCPVVIQICVI